jgi:serine/threonine protein kinase
MLPLIVVGEGAAGLPFGADAHIPHGAAPEAWLAALEPFRPAAGGMERGAAEEAEEAFGKYRLKRRVAQGGSADIYEARQAEPEGFCRTLAIKMLRERHRGDPAHVRALLDEANLAAGLDHQNIARIFDFGVESGRHYIAMEYVDGGSLASLIAKAKGMGVAFPEPIAAHIVAQAAGALDHAHRGRGDRAVGLVHLDVSPHNILVDAEGTVKLIDFGIARPAGLGPGGAGAAPPAGGGTVTLQGRLPYMSPEQALGSAADHRSDIYSLGLVLFELLTLERCFDAGDGPGLVDSVRSGSVPDIRKMGRGTSGPMVRVLDRALQRSAADRYASARELARDLAAYLGHLGQEPAEGDAAAFLAALGTSGASARAFAASRFLPVRSDFALPSERAKRHPAGAGGGKKRGGGLGNTRLGLALATASLLLILLACLLWVSTNA